MCDIRRRKLARHFWSDTISCLISWDSSLPAQSQIRWKEDWIFLELFLFEKFCKLLIRWVWTYIALTLLFYNVFPHHFFATHKSSHFGGPYCQFLQLPTHPTRKSMDSGSWALGKNSNSLKGLALLVHACYCLLLFYRLWNTSNVKRLFGWRILGGYRIINVLKILFYLLFVLWISREFVLVCVIEKTSGTFILLISQGFFLLQQLVQICTNL